MKLLRVVENEGEPCNLVCFHPVQVKYLLRGENQEPKCWAIDYDYDYALQPIYEALGWQGGTIHQIVEEIKNLKENQ